MEILTAINRPLSIREKDALWLLHGIKSQETKHESKALSLPFRRGKGELDHPSFILEAIISHCLSTF